MIADKQFIEKLDAALRDVSAGKDAELAAMLHDVEHFRRFVFGAVVANIEYMGYNGTKHYDLEDVFVMNYSHLGALVCSMLHAGIRIGSHLAKNGADLP